MLFASPIPARTFPVATPIIPRPLVSPYAPTSSSASPKAMRFCSFLSSVAACASLAFRALSVRNGRNVSRQSLKLARRSVYLLPPLRFFGPSLGIGRGLTIFDGGGAMSLSMCFSIFARRSSPYEPRVSQLPFLEIVKKMWAHHPFSFVRDPFVRPTHTSRRLSVVL